MLLFGGSLAKRPGLWRAAVASSSSRHFQCSSRFTFENARALESRNDVGFACGSRGPRLASAAYDPWAYAAIGAATCFSLMLSAPSIHHCDDAVVKSQERAQLGQWRLEKARSQSMRPYLTGLGVPGFAARFVDAIPVDLDIRVEAGTLMVTDKTILGEHTTKIELGGAEVEKETKTKRKKFMLSAFEDVSLDGHPQLTVKCRLFQRGDGWHSLQSFVWLEEEHLLREQYVLSRPDGEDVVVTRFFRSLGAVASNATGSSGLARSALKSDAEGHRAYFNTIGIAGILCAVAAVGMYFSSSGRPRSA